MNRSINAMAMMALLGSRIGAYVIESEPGIEVERPRKKRKQAPAVMKPLPHERQKPAEKSRSLRRMLKNKGRK